MPAKRGLPLWQRRVPLPRAHWDPGNEIRLDRGGGSQNKVPTRGSSNNKPSGLKSDIPREVNLGEILTKIPIHRETSS